MTGTSPRSMQHPLTLSLLVLKIHLPAHCRVRYYLPSATLGKNLSTGQWKWFDILFPLLFLTVSGREVDFCLQLSSLSPLLLLSSPVEDMFGFTWLFAYFPKASLLSSSMYQQTSTTVHLVSSWLGFTPAYSCLSSHINVTVRRSFQTSVSLLAWRFWYEKQPG